MNTNMNKDKHGFSNVIRLGLERIDSLLNKLGRPEEKLRFVHVAGTNGKGSVCAFIEAALIASGKRVGKFTSPNLVRVNERIKICGKDIDDYELDKLLNKVEKAAAELDEAPTQFEIWCAAAMLCFNEQNCDIVVLEVGLGGEFDATNVIKSPEVAVICHIDIDHTEYLGNTIKEIAKAKCGIIKENIATHTVVTGEQCSDAMEVIKAHTEAFGHTLKVAKAPLPENHEGIHEIVSLGNIKNIRLGLGGMYQIKNAAVAVAALEALKTDDDFIKAGLENALHPARFEEIGNGIIFDGGHNPDGVRELCASLDRYFPDEELTVIYACMADKDIKGVLAKLSQGKRRFIFTTVKDNPRAMGADALCEFAKRECGICGTSAPTLKEALVLAGDYGKRTIVCGSLYLYADL